MTRLLALCISIMCIPACALDEIETSSSEQAGSNMQGSNMQGVSLQGSNMQGMSLQGFRFEGATLNGAALTNVRVERGELVAEQGATPLRGAALVGAVLQGQVRTLSGPATTAVVDFRIAAVGAELAAYDPTQTGNTYLYSIEQWVPGTGSWQPACALDADGRRVAIPLAATWDERGDRIESTTMFTFGCTSGVIAKCYRWGYRPWLQGYGDLVAMHWTCTRMARADYCGDGIPHTRDGTWINVWDTLPAPGPLQQHGTTPSGMSFEAGWNTKGAVCLGHPRWITSGEQPFEGVCADRQIPPAMGGACDTDATAQAMQPAALMFNESAINVAQ